MKWIAVIVSRRTYSSLRYDTESSTKNQTAPEIVMRSASMLFRLVFFNHTKILALDVSSATDMQWIEKPLVYFSKTVSNSSVHYPDSVVHSVDGHLHIDLDTYEMFYGFSSRTLSFGLFLNHRESHLSNSSVVLYNAW